MINYDEKMIKKEHQNGVDLIKNIEKTIDKLTKEGYSNIFFVGIGGTEFYAKQMAAIVKELKSPLPLYIPELSDFT